MLILGLTFKENVGDIRNTKVVDIISELAEYDVESCIYDPYASAEEVRHEYGLEILPSLEAVPAVDAGARARCPAEQCGIRCSKG